MAGKAAATPGKTIPPMAIIAAIVILIGAAGFFYLDRVSQQSPAAPPPPSADARAYAKNLRFVADDGINLENPKMESHESYLNQAVVEISGNVMNAGDRPIDAVEVTWLFKDPGTPMPDGQLYQEVIWRQRTYLITKKMGGLAPGQFRHFSTSFDDIPDTWNQAMPNLVIAGIQFKK
ncbi:MAG TPA: hypothetical protein VHW09_01810 [Bryobacteraceae bacterium]|nr:hypothetical protein [Bryobacteraceae bacterium]